MTGEQYMPTFRENYICKSWVVSTNDHDALRHKVRLWKVFVESQSNHKFLASQTNNLLEYKALGDFSLKPARTNHKLTTV
jgi:hypothetical protein